MTTQPSLDLGLPNIPPAILFDVGKRIARGIKWLDEVGPDDWRSLIDRERLDIQSCHDCNLGQLFGNYIEGCSELRISPTREAALLGFNVLHPNSSSAKREFEALNRGWQFAFDSGFDLRKIKRLRVAA